MQEHCRQWCREDRPASVQEDVEKKERDTNLRSVMVAATLAAPRGRGRGPLDPPRLCPPLSPAATTICLPPFFFSRPLKREVPLLIFRTTFGKPGHNNRGSEIANLHSCTRRQKCGRNKHPHITAKSERIELSKSNHVDARRALINNGSQFRYVFASWGLG